MTRKDEWDKKGPNIPAALGCKKMAIVAFTAVSALVALLLLACGGLGV